MGSKLCLTPTQRRIYDLLADGLPHRREEIHALLWDELSPLSNIKMHLSRLRRRIPRHLAILCEIGARSQVRYRMVRLLPKAIPVNSECHSGNGY